MQYERINKHKRCSEIEIEGILAQHGKIQLRLLFVVIALPFVMYLLAAFARLCVLCCFLRLGFRAFLYCVFYFASVRL